jgi:hypothetical protein
MGVVLDLEIKISLPEQFIVFAGSAARAVEFSGPNEPRDFAADTGGGRD